MQEKIDIPSTEVRSRNFTVRFSLNEREQLEKFCAKKKITIADFIRFSVKTVMERAK